MITIPAFDHIGQLILWIAITVLMPLVVGLITKQSTASYWKVSLLGALALLNGVLTAWLDDFGAFDWRRALAAAAFAWVVAIASHFGVWLPTGATAKAQASLMKDRRAIAA
jgi:uncharacterized membrane protein (DUF441 family)